MTDYFASVERLHYWNGASGNPGTIAGTFPPNGQVDFGWYGNFTDPSIRGFKIVLDADGHGDMFWAWAMNNPGYPSPDYPGAPTWTADPTASQIALHNSYDAPASFVHVDGPTHYEWEFTWPGDPTFGGFVFNDPLSDLLISLAADHSSFNEVSGRLQTQWSNTDTITVSRFDLVLIGIPDGCYTVDLPAYGALAPYGGSREDTLATPDTSTEIVIADVFQDIAVGTYGATYDPDANVVLPDIPAGMTVTDARYVVIAYRESGSDITGDTSGWGYTPRGPTDQPFLFLDSSARSGQYLIDHLPIGGYGGELVSEFAESFASLQLDQPLNRLWLSYETSTAPPIHVAYLAIRLTICPALSTVAPPCQIYPRDDGQGVGSGAVWPPPSSNRPGSYY